MFQYPYSEQDVTPTLVTATKIPLPFQYPYSEQDVTYFLDRQITLDKKDLKALEVQQNG